jgi:hypothetical protein
VWTLQKRPRLRSSGLDGAHADAAAVAAQSPNRGGILSVVRVILLLAGAVFAVFFPVAVGHGLAAHTTKPMIVGAVSLVIGAVLMLALRRLDSGN